nr:hypothetical protein [Providencia rettgeri]
MDAKNRYVYFEKEQTIFRKFNNGQTQKFNPCNYPTDAMPIIIENKIAMNPKDDIWQCGSGWNVAENKNPLRACMESYLLMKDAENEKV